MPSEAALLTRTALETALPDDGKLNSATFVTLVHSGYGAEGPKYDVLYKGTTIIRRSRDPEHDAARWLLSQGITGPMTTLSKDGRPRMHFDIERAAGLSVVETSRDGLQVIKHRPLKDAVAYRDAA
jgi:hypothetical protein